MTSITFAGEQGKAFHGIFLMKCFLVGKCWPDKMKHHMGMFPFG